MTLLRDNRKLLEAFRRGDVNALEQVYYEYVDMVANVVRHGALLSGGRAPGIWNDEASDVVQETFTRAFSERARMNYDGLQEYGPYIITICRNLLIDRARKRGRECPSGIDWKDIAQQIPDESVSEAWADTEIMKIVRDYTSNLASPLRQVYEQRYMMGHSQKVTGDTLGMTRQQVRTAEAQIRLGLRKALRHTYSERT